MEVKDKVLDGIGEEIVGRHGGGGGLQRDERGTCGAGLP